MKIKPENFRPYGIWIYELWLYHIYIYIVITQVSTIKTRSATHLNINFKIILIITIRNNFFYVFLSLRVYQLNCLGYVDNKSIVSFNFVLEIPILPHFLKRSFLSNNWPKRQLIKEPVSLAQKFVLIIQKEKLIWKVEKS